MSKIFLLLGDSNVRRWIPKIGGSYRSVMDYLPSHNAVELSTALTKINSSYRTIIFAGITNILIDAASEAATNSDRLEAISKALNATMTTLSEAIAPFPDMNMFIALPTPRTKPQWVVSLQHEMCKLLIGWLKNCLAPIRPLQAFTIAVTDLDSDGVHLNGENGVPYVQGIIDAARALNEAGATNNCSEEFRYTSEVLVEVSAAVSAHEIQIRLLTDQLMLTRCQHAEESCGRQNVDTLNRFVIVGGPYLAQSDQLQSRLKSQVAHYVKSLGQNMPTDIIYVRQFRGTRGAVYDVEMGSVASSSRIRNAYGSFFRRGGRGPPPALSKVSISNSLTFATRVRIRMMKEIAKKHKLANPDLHVFVTSYLPRPTLKLKDKKGPVSTFTFCEAIQRFSHHLNSDFLTSTTRYANTHIARDDLTPFFLLLSPDLLRGPIPLSLTPDKISPGPSTPLQSTSTSTSTSASDQTRKRKPTPQDRRTSQVSTLISKRGRPNTRGKTIPNKRGPYRKASVNTMDHLTQDSQDESDAHQASTNQATASPPPASIVPIDFSEQASAIESMAED